MKRIFKIIAIIIGAGVLLIVTLAFFGPAIGNWWMQDFVRNDRQLERRLGEPLPVEASDIYYTSYRYNSNDLWLRFTYPADETGLTTWLESLGKPLDTTYTTTTTNEITATQPFGLATTDWWQVEESDNLKFVVFGSSSENRFEIVIDQDDAEDWIIYVHNTKFYGLR